MRALVLFHLRVGARLALVAAAPLAAAPVVGVLLQQDPGAALRAAARWLVGAPADTGAGVALAAICLLLASWATQRIAVAQAGWLRHLPASEATQRRAALLGAMAAQSQVLAAVVLLAPFAATGRGDVCWSRFVSLPLTAAAAALLAWPARGSWGGRTLALIALALLAPASRTGILVACPLLLVSERLCGSLALRSGRARRSSRLPAELLVPLRALGPGSLLLVLPALLPIAAMAALRINNPLEPAVARGAARFGGALAVVFLLASVADRLALRRPVWAWVRSLPCTALARVRNDALLLGAFCLVPLSITAALDGIAALQVAGCLPALALHAAGALHPRDARQQSAGGEVLAPGLFVAGAVALLPSLWTAALLAAPVLARAAARRDREQKVSRWLERHHRVIGDPLSWSAR